MKHFCVSKTQRSLCLFIHNAAFAEVERRSVKEKQRVANRTVKSCRQEKKHRTESHKYLEKYLEYLEPKMYKYLHLCSYDHSRYQINCLCCPVKLAQICSHLLWLQDFE